MGSKLKEDERNERTIRALLKQSENRRCINCGSLGPQYVCTTFSIFVCTNCSGLHREFTHRIKSVSMAKFTAEEVRSLQAGGNERGRETFLKEFDLQRTALPDSSNPDKLRNFIKSVYVERRYTGDRAPPKGRQGDREDSYEFRRHEPRSDARLDAQSPPFEDRHDDRRSMERRRSDVDRGRYDDRRFDDRVVRFEEKRSPGRFEPDRSRFNQKQSQYDDRRHEDRNRYDERERDRRGSYDDRFANEIRHDRRKSADDRLNAKDFGGDSPPVRPVTEILGDNVPALWVSEDHRQTNCREDDDRSSLGSPAERRDVRMPKLGSFGTVNGPGSVPTAAVKRVNSGSLIDFSAEPEPSVTSVSAIDPFGVSSVVVPQPTTVSISSTGWATFDTAPAATATLPAAEGPPAGYPDVFLAPANEGQWAAGGWPSSQTASTPSTDNWSSLVGSTAQQSIMAAGSQPLQAWKSFPPASSDPISHSDVQLLKPGLVLEQPRSSLGIPVAPAVDRSRELPKELFAHSFPTVGMPTGGLGMGQQNPGFAPTPQPFGLGAMPTYAQPPRSRNPFDLPGDVGPSAGMGNFPSLGSLQAALPNGPSSVPATVAPTSSNQWSLGLQPASYPPSGPAGGSGSSFVTQLSITPSTTHVQTSGPLLGYSGSGSFNSRGLLASDNSGGSEFSTQNFLQTVSGNPFG